MKGLSVWLVSKQTHKQTYKQTHIGTTIKMKQKNKISIAVLAALTSFGSAIADETQDSQIEVIQVSGIYKSMSKSLSEKRYADSIVDTINADDIGKFPDENLAESLQRITGVSISRQDGEGQQVSIRGLGPSFNKVTLNGRTATSGTGSRSFSFDLLASELVSSLEVVKSPTADLDEGGLGGTINVNTAKPLDYDEFKFVASAKGVYNELSDDWGPQTSALISNTFADNTLGFLGSVAFSDRNLRNDGYAQNGYVNLLPDIGDYINNSDSIYPLNTVPDLTLQNRKKMNFYGVVQWQPSDSFELVFDVLKADFDKESDQYLLALPPLRGGFVVNDVKADDFGSINYLDVDSGFSNANVSNKFETSSLTMYSLNGTLSDDNWSLYSEVSHSNSKSDNRVTNGIIDITRNPGTAGENNIVFDWTENYRIPTIIADFPYDEYSGQIYRLGLLSDTAINDEETAAKFDFTLELDNEYFSSIETGVKYSERTFEREYYSTGNRSFASSGVAENVLPADAEIAFPVDDFLSEEAGEFPRSWAVFDPAILTSYFNIDSVAKEFDASRYGLVQEDVFAAYFRANYTLDTELPVIGNFGLRYVTTDQASVGYTSEPIAIDDTSRPGDLFFVFGASEEQRQSNSYSELLWNINANISLNDDMNLKLAAARVMSRADISALSPGFSSVSGPNRRITTGNPNLSPYLANQFDVSFEWYFAETGALTLAAFYKDIESVIETKTLNVDLACCGITESYEFTRPENSPGGTLHGFEIGYQTVFSMLPAPFNKSGIQTNYTYVDSDIGDDGTSSENHSLVGLSKHTANVSFFYEDETFGSRISYNYRGDYLSQAPNASGQSQYTESHGQLDASLSYNLNERVSFTLDGINLTNEDTYQYIDVQQHSDRLSYTGRRFFVGVRFVY